MKISDLPETMSGVLLNGHGGFDQMSYHDDLPVPKPAPGEVLIKVGASAINNTDINTRIGWYSKGVSGGTAGALSHSLTDTDKNDASWSGQPLKFPRIQGADCCGRIVAVGEGVSLSRIGERVLVRPMFSPSQNASAYQLHTFGSECNGAFAEYTVAPAWEAFSIQSELTDAELASFPCAYSTAEGMLERASVGSGDRVLITGASGGVGSAAVQLAKRRGAEVIAVSSASKAGRVLALGADQVMLRDVSESVGQTESSVDVVVDLVGGDSWPDLLNLLKRGGRYVVSGAIAGPLVELDLRTLYLKDLSLFGSTWQPAEVFENLIRYIENGEVKPQVVQAYPLSDLVTAQEAFLAKEFVGKLVVLPDSQVAG